MCVHASCQCGSVRTRPPPASWLSWVLNLVAAVAGQISARRISANDPSSAPRSPRRYRPSSSATIRYGSPRPQHLETHGLSDLYISPRRSIESIPHSNTRETGVRVGVYWKSMTELAWFSMKPITKHNVTWSRVKIKVMHHHGCSELVIKWRVSYLMWKPLSTGCNKRVSELLKTALICWNKFANENLKRLYS